MILVQDQKPEVKPEVEPAHHSPDESAGESRGDSDLPPVYDALSIHRSSSHHANKYSSLSAFSDPNEGSSSDPPSNSNFTILQHPVPNIDTSLPCRPLSSPKDTPSSSKNTGHVLPQGPHAHTNTSCPPPLPFASSFSAKQVRQSALSIISDLVIPTSCVISKEQKNAHEILASLAETCAEHKLSLSTILQETAVADHTPMYWAVVNYREELLVALLVHSRPLSVHSISDIRRACLDSSNQGLFHALRVCRPPFHKTDGVQLPGLRAASDNLLLDNRASDEIRIKQMSDRGFVVSFDIPLWQRRMKVIGQVNIEFIVSGRMWSITFFSTDSSSTEAASGKSKQATSKWHVMVGLLESSQPTFLHSKLVVDAPPPTASHPTHTPRLRGARSTTLPRSRNKGHQNWSSMYDYNCDERIYSRPSETGRYRSSSSPKPPAHPLRGSLLPPISIYLQCGNRKLGCRIDSGEPPELMVKPTTKPDTWLDNGVGYTNAAVSPLGEGLASQLLHEHSQYLSPDGTLRGRLEARFVKTETIKGCIVC